MIQWLSKRAKRTALLLGQNQFHGCQVHNIAIAKYQITTALHDIKNIMQQEIWKLVKSTSGQKW